jgi:DNA-binding NarL/FixJ family response regulator
MAGEQILVVEDQRAVAGALKMRLRGLGYDVAAIAKDGFEAIEKAAELHPDLILMDVRLGEGMDGIEAARRIRSSLDIPVIYISAHVDQKLLERARSTGPAGFINKPFTTKDLLTAIDLALHGKARQTLPERGGEAANDASASDGLVTTDSEGRIGFANRIAEALLGVNRRQLIDRPLADLLANLYDLLPGRAAELVAKVLRGDGEEQLERAPGGRGSGAQRQQRDVLTPLFDTSGQTYGVALKLATSMKPVSERAGSGNEPAFAQALDTMPNGILIVGPDLRIHHMNRSGREILARNRGVECRNGSLTVQDKLLEQRLRELVRAALARGRADQSDATGAMFVRAPLSREHVELIVAPVPGSGAEEQNARALVYLFDANSPRQVSHDMLTGLYGLTQTEAKLVQLMSNGMTLDEAAQELEISVNTARTHLKHVFHKTGINRQTELIHRIGCGPASLLVRYLPATQA